jgi:hypothetical protein
MSTFIADANEFNIEFKFTSAKTSELLQYDGMERKNIMLYYDIELFDISNSEVTTILAGQVEVVRSISGKI